MIIANEILLLLTIAETETEIMTKRTTIPQPIMLLMQSSLMLENNRLTQRLNNSFIDSIIIKLFFLML